MKVQKHHWLIVLSFIGVFILAVVFFRNAQIQSGFLGLPTVPCFDVTKPTTQSYTLHISISVNGKDYPLAATIGHDPGNCLRVVHTEDASGLVYVETNDHVTYTLQNLFQVWRKTFTAAQFDSYQADNGHILSVYLNGKLQRDMVDTPLLPNSIIEVVYQ
jgi:hypothetical protein